MATPQTESRRDQRASFVWQNNAGVQHISPLEEFPESKWDLILAVNLSACFHTMKAALPSMRRTGWGRVVNVASGAPPPTDPSKPSKSTL